MTDVGLLILALGVFGLLACFPIWLLVSGIRRGVFNIRGVDVSREDRPLTFWLGIIFYGFMAAACFVLPAELALEILAQK